MDEKLIPGTKGFTVSIDGTVKDSAGRIKNRYVNGDGYITCAVINDKGKWQTYGVHRLVALAHIPTTLDTSLLVVNHKDKDKTNPHKSNLEWVTDKLNNIHAVLFRGNYERPCIIAESPEGKYEFISNIQTVAKRFKCDTNLVWDCIRNNTSLGGWKFKHYGNKDKKPVELHKNKMCSERKNGRLASKAISVKNIEDQRVLDFDSFAQAASYFDTTPSHVYKSICDKDKKRLFKGKYLIVNSGNVFPSLSQSEYEFLKSSVGKEVIAYNEETKKLFIYESASKFILNNGLSKKAVSVSLKTNKLRKVRNWWFIYNTKENNERLKAIMDRPGT